MLRNVVRPRTAVSLALIVPAATLLVVAACNDDSSSSSSGGFDGGACALAPCFDGSVGKPDATTPEPDGSITDAGAVPDADPWADADTTCSNYTTAATTSPTSVKIRNLRTSPIYVGWPKPSCEYNLGFEFHDQADAAIAASQNTPTCADYQSATCPAAFACQPPIVTKIERDGGVLDIGWPGTVFRDRYMAKTCYADAGCATGPCLQQYAAPSGNIHVVAYTGFYCDAGSCIDCTTGANGTCLVSNVTGTTGTALTGDHAYTAGQGGSIVVDVQ